jgi:hypothetical protein
MRYLKEVEPPRVAVPDEAEDAADVVAEDHLAPVSAVDETGAVEQLVILGESAPRGASTVCR